MTPKPYNFFDDDNVDADADDDHYNQAMALLIGHPSRDVFMFVHGFNTPLCFGVRTTAAQGRALRKSLTVCLAWPSDPPGEGAGWLIKRVSGAACCAPICTMLSYRGVGWGGLG